MFFTHKLVDQSLTVGGSIIDKGTNGGGSVEVYKTIEDAKNRNAYLSNFDGNGFFKVGSHNVVGTIIIRTSDFLTGSQQKALESKLIESFVR